MDLARLRAAENAFLERYPGGFADPELEAVGKKHRLDKMTELAQNTLAKKKFTHTGQVIEDIITIVKRSSMVSMFEKPKFRDFVNGLNTEDRAFLANGFKRLLHGKQEAGFNDIVDVLREGKIAKWSLVTICLLYYRPETEVFVKPTTTKNVIKYLELEDLVYKPQPTWDFYQRYRDVINDAKSKVSPSLSPNNAAFTGFLMITLEPVR